MRKNTVDLRCPQCNTVLYGSGEEVAMRARIQSECVCPRCKTTVYATEDTENDRLNQILRENGGKVYYYATTKPAEQLA